MDSDRWRRVEALFAAVADLEPGERRERLAAARAGDPDLVREVERLLAHDGDAGASIAAAVAGAAEHLAGDAGRLAGAAGPLAGDPRTLHDASAAPLPGGRIGPYRIERELGHGGMGTVCLAARDDDAYRKRVAIKLMRASVPAALRQRFLAERRILAALDHPNIARLLDAGTTESGEPYVVMEYVDGRPIDVHCDQGRLPTRDRLELFRKVCAAVQFAHRNLVVHRDLKPGNVLVTADGEAKLLDFGIAKLLDPAAPGAGPETGTTFRMMTPEYASPEQIRGEPVTTASDIYSLGVLLYELMAGRRPYRLKTPQSGELERAILEQEAERPSAAVLRPAGPAGEAATAEAIGRARSTSPSRLRRRLAGDLDNIVLMALSKEASRRYASVAQLAEDVGRHLDGLPVLARPATLTYRTRKFLRRHRAGVAAAAAVVVLMTGLVGF
jgi:serine/threonine protein kinase